MRNWKGRRRWFFQWTFMLCLIHPVIINCHKEKRQIFREQVLPALGGKIPEDAFRTDRLALNRLNKEGITVVDGVILEARHSDKHPTHARVQPDVIKVYATVDNRYVPPEGRYHYDQPKTVDTTYVIRKPIDNAGQTETKRPNYHEFTYLPPAKAHNYMNFLNRKIPISITIPPQIQPQIYKPIVRPLIIPARDILFSGFYHPSWNHPQAFQWSTSIFGEGFHGERVSVFDTSQIINNYKGFLNDYHNRQFRHAENPTHANTIKMIAEATKTSEKSAYKKLTPLVASKVLNTGMSIPETGFSCKGRIGTFADVEVNCQVFHECSEWKKTSFTCPFGTAYSEELKRCEWSHQVQCSGYEREN